MALINPMGPFEEGYRAGLCGDDPRTCPYEKLTKEWQEWNRGQHCGCLYIEAHMDCYQYGTR